jgi:hypothetical protein
MRYGKKSANNTTLMEGDFCSRVGDRNNNGIDYHNVLVLGEAGVGKTSFIRAVRECVEFRRHTFSDKVYNPTKGTFIQYIPEVNTSTIICQSVLENVNNNKFSKEVSNLIMNPHLLGDERFFLINKYDLTNSNIVKDRNIGEVSISEISANIKRFPPGFSEHFDKIIIMGDYPDITTLRSIHCWIENIKAPPNKIIVCVNKCDISPITIEDDLQSRKAKVLLHFFDNYKLEFISVKTCANLMFIYKYL